MNFKDAMNEVYQATMFFWLSLGWPPTLMLQCFAFVTPVQVICRSNAWIIAEDCDLDTVLRSDQFTEAFWCDVKVSTERNLLFDICECCAKVLMLENRVSDFGNLLYRFPLGQSLVPSAAWRVERNPEITSIDSPGSIWEFLVKVKIRSKQPSETIIPRHEGEICNHNVPFHQVLLICKDTI